MKERKKLLHDVDKLGESIAKDWADLKSMKLTTRDRRKIRKHLAACVSEVTKLLDRLEKE